MVCRSRGGERGLGMLKFPLRCGESFTSERVHHAFDCTTRPKLIALGFDGREQNLTELVEVITASVIW